MKQYKKTYPVAVVAFVVLALVVLAFGRVVFLVSGAVVGLMKITLTHYLHYQLIILIILSITYRQSMEETYLSILANSNLCETICYRQCMHKNNKTSFRKISLF